MIGNRQFLKDNVYFFEKEYKSKIFLHQIIQSDADVDKGTRKIVKNVYPIICAKLPTEVIRRFVQDIGYLAANKNFTYGALNDFDSTKWLIRKFRFPKGLKPDLNFHIVENNIRYDETKIESLWDGEVFVLSGKAVEGASPYQVFELNLAQNLNVYHEEHHEFN